MPESVDELVACPYNTAHHVYESRLAIHLIKCSKRSPIKKMVCPYEATHHVDKDMYEEHLKTCSTAAAIGADFLSFRNQVAQEMAAKNEQKDESDKDTESDDGPLGQMEENWDLLAGKVGTYNAEELSKNKKVLRISTLKSKNERRKFRKQEKKRYAALLESTSESQMASTCDWQVHKQKVNERGQHLLETSQWSDCRFVVGTEPNQQEFRGHKLFLAMSSPVFEAMFFGGMAEKNDPIPILDVQPDAFKALLEYIYTDNINLQSFDQACELCYVAKKYMLPFLVEECTRHLWEDLYPKNACRAYEFAKLFEEPVLMEKCLTIISSETEAVLQESSFEDIELSTLSTILEMDELSVTELELFNAIQRWAAHECIRKGLSPDEGKALRSVLGAAVGKLRFLTLTPAQFAEGPALSPLLTQDESFAILMNISSSTAGKMPMPEGFSTSTSMRKRPPLQSTLHSTGNDLEPCLLPHIGDVTREGRKFYCLRNILYIPHCLNSSILDCSVTFRADKNICVLGVQVPSQVLGGNQEYRSDSFLMPSDESYTELLYAHLLDSDGSRLTYTHFTSRVNYNSLIEIGFNRPVYIQKNKLYKVGVVLNKGGWYPMGNGSKRVVCDTVFFTFCIGKSTDSVRDAFIRSIIFTY